jgi:hypothetical protein
LQFLRESLSDKTEATSNKNAAVYDVTVTVQELIDFISIISKKYSHQKSSKRLKNCFISLNILEITCSSP